MNFAFKAFKMPKADWQNYLQDEVKGINLVNPSSHFIDNHTGCSVARLSRHVWDVEAAGSNPATPTF